MNWSEKPYPLTFPYAMAIQAVRRHGKHLMNPLILAAFDQARCALTREPRVDGGLLRKFLDVVLDKHDGT